MDVSIKQMPAFKKAYKKLHSQQKAIVNDAINKIINDPLLGDEKKGDLAGIYVYKFKINSQEILLAYTWNALERILMALGVHENFYRNLKRTI